MQVPSTTPPPTGYTIHAEIKLEVPVEHGLLIENLLDLAHAPFTHQATFAKDWPVPDAVKFHANKLLSGQWDPYPIEMAFQPPCMVRVWAQARMLASSCLAVYQYAMCAAVEKESQQSIKPPALCVSVLQTISNIGLAQPGKIMRGVTAHDCERHLHQLHVCTPSKKGYTRLLYRMSMDFMSWIKYVPNIEKVWKGVAGQVRVLLVSPQSW